MNSPTDQQLLRDYAERRVETAFAELVRRHVDLVYSAALRMVRDSHLAEDVAQAVFTALAKNAGQLADRAVLSGWLHRTAQNLAANTVRADARRRAREQEAAAMNELHAAAPEAGWDHIAPHLDDALGELSEPDRDALLLRYFERQSARQMAHTLGTSEEAAQKRVHRAVERLRELFAKRGVTVAAGGLVFVISANAVQAAPTGLAVTITATTLTAGSTLAATATTVTATKAIAMTTLQKILLTAGVAVIAGAGIYEAHQASRLRDELQSLRQQQAPLTVQVQQLTEERDLARTQFAEQRADNERLNGNSAELLRLRAEVGALRREQRELAQAADSAQRGRSGSVAGAAPEVTPPPASPAPQPLQLQLVMDEPGDDTMVMTNSTRNASEATLYVQKTPLLSQTFVSSATVATTSMGTPRIDIVFNPEGQQEFARITRENINKRLAIVMNGKVYSAPVIRSEISGGIAQIEGNFTADEAQELAAKINEAIARH